MLMEMAGSRSCRGSALHDDGPNEQNARGPSVEVDVYTRDEQFVLISRAQLCAAGDDGKWCKPAMNLAPVSTAYRQLLL